MCLLPPSPSTPDACTLAVWQRSLRSHSATKQGELGIMNQYHENRVQSFLGRLSRRVDDTVYIRCFYTVDAKHLERLDRLRFNWAGEQ